MAQIPTDPSGTTSKGLALLKRPWTWLVGFVTLTGALLLNITTVLANLRELPEELRKTEDQFSTWYFEDDEWDGYWTSSPEGYVDGAGRRLTPEDFAIKLAIDKGQIDGMISTRPICDTVPAFDYILLRGDVDWFGDSASVIAFDFFEGRQVDIAELRLHRDGIVMEVEPVEEEVSLFSQSRIAKDAISESWPNEFCEGKRARLVETLRKLPEELLDSKKPK